MNKAELVSMMSAKSNLTKKDSESALNAFIETVQTALQNGEIQFDSQAGRDFDDMIYERAQVILQKEKKSKKDKDKAKEEEVNPEAEATAKEPDEEVETTNEEEGES